MPDTIDKQIVQALITRCGRILTANGYNTNAGLHVYLNRPDWDTRDLPSVTLFPGEGEPLGDPQGNRQQWERQIRIDGLMNSDIAEPDFGIEDLLGDMHFALFDEADGLPAVAALNGLVRKILPVAIDTQPRDPGGLVMGATITLRVQYVVGLSTRYE